MKLTPIKVKGKKGQGKARAAAGPQHTGILKPQRGRDATGGNDSDDGRRRRRLRPRNLVAPIEQLPSEILERIVFMSMNLNLLRSSHRIGRRFSSRSFFTELLECALSPTWDQWFGCPQREMQSYHGHLRDYERFAGNPNFQSAVLACPWVDITLILEAQQKWYRRHGAGRYFQHDSGPEGGDPGHAAGGFDHAKDVAACFERDWNEFLPGENGPRYFDVHPLTRIPERLLTGPLDWEKAKQLFWLIRGGASLEPANAWELTKPGYEHIMAQEDKDLAVCLLGLFHKKAVFDVHWPMFLLEEKLHEARLEDARQQTPDTSGAYPFAPCPWRLAHKLLDAYYSSRFTYRTAHVVLSDTP